MDIQPIRTDDDHIAALKEIERLWNAEDGTPEGDRLDILLTLAHEYEERHWPIEAVDPVEAILGSMAFEGRTQADLAALLGSASRASEILNRKRALTLPMIWKLHREWRIPAELLVRPYDLAA